MKIIINTSTISASGATQVATSFISECINYSENDYFILLSNTVQKQLAEINFPDNFKFYKIESHPAYGWKGFKTRIYLKKLEREIRPDAVFSVFGPSWWTPKSPHLQGYAYAHYVYQNSPLFSKLSFKEKIKIKLMKYIHLYFLNKNGNHFVSETEDVTQRLEKLLPQSKNKFYSVGNTYNEFFTKFIKGDNDNILEEKKESEFRFLSLCTYQVHKNLEILNKVIPLIKDRNIGMNIKFVLTIDEDSFNKKFTEEAKKSIINLGRIDVKDCPQLYYECDGLFLPTLLECFSANYPEAMFMGKPILTSNLTFATTVCKNAAYYFDPMNEYDIVNKIELICTNKDKIKEIVCHGKERMNDFPTSSERAKEYLEICKNIVK